MGFFDDSTKGKLQIGDSEVVLHLFDTKFIHIKHGLGIRTNNHVEMMGIKFLLSAVIEKNDRSLQVFGDSMLIMNWEKRVQWCHNLRLLPLFEEFFLLFQHFESISIAHVYKEQNQTTDKLSKEGSQKQASQAQI